MNPLNLPRSREIKPSHLQHQSEINIYLSYSYEDSWRSKLKVVPAHFGRLIAVLQLRLGRSIKAIMAVAHTRQVLGELFVIETRETFELGNGRDFGSS
jgi:hypothetical protein